MHVSATAPNYFQKKPSDLIHPRYCHSANARVREICPEMHALAQMAEMAINRQTINKKRFRRKWRIW